MKRLLIIVGLLCLLVDLGDDGLIGQVKIVTPQSPYASASYQQDADEHLDVVFPSLLTAMASLVTRGAAFWRSRGYRLVSLAIPCRVTLACLGHLCSAGGLPK
jgi:hypothetical protein